MSYRSFFFFCLLPSAFCLLPSAFCLLPTAPSFPHTPSAKAHSNKDGIQNGRRF
jgi:hypothetical protein